MTPAPESVTSKAVPFKTYAHAAGGYGVFSTKADRVIARCEHECDAILIAACFTAHSILPADLRDIDGAASRVVTPNFA